jgi:hypothetical protein
MKSPRYWQFSSPVPSDSCNFAPSGVSVTLAYRGPHADVSAHVTPIPEARSHTSMTIPRTALLGQRGRRWTAPIGSVGHRPRKGVKLPVPEGASGGLHQRKPGVTALHGSSPQDDGSSGACAVADRQLAQGQQYESELDGIGPEMPWQLSDAAGSGIAPPRTLTLVEVNSYCPAPHCPWQLSVPPDTPPSSPFIVAPLLTWQICPGGPAWQPDIEPSPSVSAFAG